MDVPRIRSQLRQEKPVYIQSAADIPASRSSLDDALLICGHNEFRYFFRPLIYESNAILGCVFLCLNPSTDSFFIFRCEPTGASHDSFYHTNGFFHLCLDCRKRDRIVFRYKSTAFTRLFKMMLYSHRFSHSCCAFSLVVGIRESVKIDDSIPSSHHKIRAVRFKQVLHILPTGCAEIPPLFDQKKRAREKITSHFMPRRLRSSLRELYRQHSSKEFTIHAGVTVVGNAEKRRLRI